MTIAITGATGHIGGLVTARLAAEMPGLRLIGRNSDRLRRLADFTQAETVQAEYGDTEAMQNALRGITTVFFVSATESDARQQDHATVVAAARTVGVRRIIYLSFLGAAPDATFTHAQVHYATEQRIVESGLAYTFVRDAFYQAAVAHFAGEDGEIKGPAGDGMLNPVAHDDVADVVAALLRSAAAADADDTPSPHDGQTYTLTGPETMTFSGVARVLADVAGRPVRYIEETVDEAYASRAPYQAPKVEMDAWVSTYTAVAAGEMDLTTDTVQRLTGHPATSLRDYLQAHPDSHAHLTQ